MWNISKYSLKSFANQIPVKRNTIISNIKPILSDVSLCNGFHQIPLNYKKNLFYNILWNYNPANIEIGSLLYPEIMPNFLSSLDFFKEINEESGNIFKFWEKNKGENIYVFLNNSEKLNLAIKKNVKCFSLTTPIHSNFPRSQKELNQIFDILNKSLPENKTKLYISCTNEWTEEGVIDSEYIINKILNYYEKYHPDLLCLSDTFGLLDAEEYEYIVDNCIYFGLPSSKICVNLYFNHNNKKQIANAKRIVHHSLNKKITNFDVSKQYLDFYGSRIRKKNEIMTNLSYELFNNFLKEYNDKKNN